MVASDSCHCIYGHFKLLLCLYMWSFQAAVTSCSCHINQLSLMYVVASISCHFRIWSFQSAVLYVVISISCPICIWSLQVTVTYVSCHFNQLSLMYVVTSIICVFYMWSLQLVVTFVSGHFNQSVTSICGQLSTFLYGNFSQLSLQSFLAAVIDVHGHF